MAAYLVDGGVLTEVCGEVYVANSATIGDGTLVSRIRAGGKLLLIFEGGRYLVVGSDPATEGQGGELLKEAYSTSRLLPLLAQYLDPVSYDSCNKLLHTRSASSLQPNPVLQALR
jgi:hypothetical protein